MSTENPELPGLQEPREEDLRRQVREHLTDAETQREMALRMAERCYEIHGVRIDVDNPESWTA